MFRSGWTIVITVEILILAVLGCFIYDVARGPGSQADGNPAETAAASADEVEGGGLAPVTTTPAILPSLQPFVLSREGQTEEYGAERPKSVIQLQQFREATTLEINDGADREGEATLVNLNPRANGWFLLGVEWADHLMGGVYHLENAWPERQQIALEAAHPHGLVIIDQERGPHVCDLWSASGQIDLPRAAVAGKPYVPLCDGRLFLRNPVEGRRTTKEWVTELLRSKMWEGEKIVNFVKESFYQDAFLNVSEVTKGEGDAPAEQAEDEPFPALVDPNDANATVAAESIGLELEDATRDKLQIGRWYRVKDMPGVFLSAIQPQLVSDEVIRAQQKLVDPLDAVEAKALVYLVAFDLERFDVGFAMGTETPAVGWSERVVPAMHSPKLPGPDGFDNVAPLANPGMLNPLKVQRTIATFTAGFKRHHGAFRWGAFAMKNHGSHYGFVEEGVVMSKLQPGLATFVQYDDGRVDLKTWTDADNDDLESVRYARQNGVPLIDFDEKAGQSKVGALVRQHLPGNWSGAQDMSYRTLRAGLGLQEGKDRRFLIYGYFSAARPSALARAFQAYQCKYAMHLDMNALEHTYLALYRHDHGKFALEHLVQGMDVLDKPERDKFAPRFIGYPDNRDFFYVMQKAEP
jgi:hypothetical protein